MNNTLYIEYAAYYGSMKIFNYLFNSKDINDSNNIKEDEYSYSGIEYNISFHKRKIIIYGFMQFKEINQKSFIYSKKTI